MMLQHYQHTKNLVSYSIRRRSMNALGVKISPPRSPLGWLLQGPARSGDVPPIRRLPATGPPMCYSAADFWPVTIILPRGGRRGRRWISACSTQAWKHTQLITDVVPGRGGGAKPGKPEWRAFSRGRVFSDAESSVEAGARSPAQLYECGERPLVGSCRRSDDPDATPGVCRASRR